MRYPAFVAEIGRDDKRADIQAGIWTGYATALFFGGVAWYAVEHGVLLPMRGLAVLVVAKLVTNTLSWITLRARVLHLEFAALNIAADLFVMTGAVYATGGPASPLVAIYVIEATVMALLTNLGLTIVTVVTSCLLFGGMCVLVRAGVLPLLPTPFEHVGSLTPAYMSMAIASFTGLIVIPGVYVALIVQRLRDKEAALVEAARAKSQFMANITHELRTPLHGILGLADLLREGIYGPVNERQKEGVAGIDQSAKNLLELIDAMLLLARAEAAKLEVVVAPVSVSEVVNDVAAAGRRMRGTKELTLDAAADDDLPPVHTDRRKLTHLLVNLVANAVKFTPEGGRVAITARRAGRGVAILVSDDGIGIPRYELARVFEEFHQVDASTSRAYGGAGLGLALVQMLARLLAAEVSVESEEGKGSTFTVVLPERGGRGEQGDRRGAS